MTRRGAATVSAFVPRTGDQAFDDWIAPQRAAAIARILRRVSKNAEDEVQLADDIYRAYVATPSDLDLYEGSKAAKRLKKVRDILKGVEKQAALISADPYISATIDKHVGVKPPPIRELLFELRSFENTLASLAKKWSKKADLPLELKGRRPSELEWLAGVLLPLVYERHFLSRAGRSRNAEGEPGGPTVRFIEVTLTELGMPYARESIVRAFTRLAPLRNARRGTGDRPKNPLGKLR